jgi:hypothetical protein
MSFVEMAICDICSKTFKTKTNPPAALKNRKMSFKQFESAKIRLNKLKSQWLKNFYLQSIKNKKMESEIKILQEDLETNIYLTLLFQPGKRI